MPMKMVKPLLRTVLSLKQRGNTRQEKMPMKMVKPELKVGPSLKQRENRTQEKRLRAGP
jgi:hypothetical protein